MPTQCFYLSQIAMCLQGSIRSPRVITLVPGKTQRLREGKLEQEKDVHLLTQPHILPWLLTLRGGNHPAELEAALLNTEIRATGTLPSPFCQKLDQILPPGR